MSEIFSRIETIHFPSKKFGHIRLQVECCIICDVYFGVGKFFSKRQANKIMDSIMKEFKKQKKIKFDPIRSTIYK